MQRYLLGVSHNDTAKMSLLSVEQFIERTMDYATDYALFSCTAIETMDMAKAYLYLYDICFLCLGMEAYVWLHGIILDYMVTT